MARRFSILRATVCSTSVRYQRTLGPGHGSRSLVDQPGDRKAQYYRSEQYATGERKVDIWKKIYIDTVQVGGWLVTSQLLV